MKFKKEMSGKFCRAIQILGLKRLSLQCAVFQTTSIEIYFSDNTRPVKRSVSTDYTYSENFKELFCTRKHFLKDCLELSESRKKFGTACQLIPDSKYNSFYTLTIVIKRDRDSYAHQYLWKLKADM